jgi:hypothetical protein
MREEAPSFAPIKRGCGPFFPEIRKVVNPYHVPQKCLQLYAFVQPAYTATKRPFLFSELYGTASQEALHI